MVGIFVYAPRAAGGLSFGGVRRGIRLVSFRWPRTEGRAWGAGWEEEQGRLGNGFDADGQNRVSADAGCDHVTLVPKFTNGIPPREVNCDGTVRYDGAAVDCPSTPISKPEYGRGWRPLGVR